MGAIERFIVFMFVQKKSELNVVEAYNVGIVIIDTLFLYSAKQILVAIKYDVLSWYDDEESSLVESH